MEDLLDGAAKEHREYSFDTPSTPTQTYARDESRSTRWKYTEEIRMKAGSFARHPLSLLARLGLGLAMAAAIIAGISMPEFAPNSCLQSSQFG